MFDFIVSFQNAYNPSTHIYTWFSKYLKIVHSIR